MQQILVKFNWNQILKWSGWSRSQPGEGQGRRSLLGGQVAAWGHTRGVPGCHSWGLPKALPWQRGAGIPPELSRCIPADGRWKRAEGDKARQSQLWPSRKERLSELMLNLFPRFSSFSFIPRCADCQGKRADLGGSPAALQEQPGCTRSVPALGQRGGILPWEGKIHRMGCREHQSSCLSCWRARGNRRFYLVELGDLRGLSHCKCWWDFHAGFGVRCPWQSQGGCREKRDLGSQIPWTHPGQHSWVSSSTDGASPSYSLLKNPSV